MEKSSSYLPLNEKDFEVVRRYSNERSGSVSSSRNDTVFEIPLKLKKTYYCSISLLIFGIILIIIGFIRALYKDAFNDGLSFFILATISLIPGVFYSYQFCKARLTNDYDKRKEILADIPQL